MCMRMGWSLEYVCGMDVLTFNAVLENLLKIEYRDRTEDTWAQVVAGNAAFTGDTTAFKALTKSWSKVTGEKMEANEGDSAGFLQALGMGAAGGRI